MIARFGRPLALALLASGVIAAAPTPPPALAAYIDDGRFDPGDYGWLRGMFAGASAAEKAGYRAVVDWRRRCRIDDMAETRADLAAIGADAGASLDSIPYRSLLCDQVATLPEPLDLRDWAGFLNDVAAVRPIASSYLAAVSAAEDAAALKSPDLRDALNARTIGEQMLRSGLAWSQGSASSVAAEPVLTAQQRGILSAELAIALAVRDHANTAWLKGIVAKEGWPLRSKVGDTAAKAAWLLIQHADADPAFQIRILRLMEPLLSSGEVDRRKYAYLYDRVALKTSGKQRYATQLTCRSGRFVSRPLEDERSVDARRRQAGLDPLAVYQARALKDMGPCRDDPTGR